MGHTRRHIGPGPVSCGQSGSRDSSSRYIGFGNVGSGHNGAIRNDDRRSDFGRIKHRHRCPSHLSFGHIGSGRIGSEYVGTSRISFNHLGYSHIGSGHIGHGRVGGWHIGHSPSGSECIGASDGRICHGHTGCDHIIKGHIGFRRSSRWHLSHGHTRIERLGYRCIGAEHSSRRHSSHDCPGSGNSSVGVQPRCVSSSWIGCRRINDGRLGFRCGPVRGRDRRGPADGAARAGRQGDIVLPSGAAGYAISACRMEWARGGFCSPRIEWGSGVDDTGGRADADFLGAEIGVVGGADYGGVTGLDELEFGGG